MAFERVARVEDIPAGGGLKITIGRIEVGLFAVGGQVHAMENRCPHADLPLSEGLLDGYLIECAGHAWTFDVRTGFRPDYEDGFPIPCFAVEVRGGDVYVDIENSINLRRRR